MGCCQFARNPEGFLLRKKHDILPRVCYRITVMGYIQLFHITVAHTTPYRLFSAETRSSTLFRNCSSVMDGSRVASQISQGTRSQEAQFVK